MEPSPSMTVERPVEVELKYRVTAAAAGARLLRDDHLGALDALGPAREERHDDRYFDTEAGSLAVAGYAARLRETGDGVLLSVKATPDGTGALHRREELEGPATALLNPRLWPASDAQALIVRLVGDAEVVELVRLRQVRRRRDFGTDGTSVEMSLDDVEILRADSVVDRFVELEVELKTGSESALGPVSEVLDGTAGLAVSHASKLAFALTAIGSLKRTGDEPARNGVQDAADAGAGAAAAPVLRVGKTPGVVAEDSLAEAGRKVLRFHLARMLAREKGTREGTDVEELHGMRVATRRMRAAWRVFGDAYRGGGTRRIQRSLKEVAAHLGAVRDLDVLIESGERHAAELPGGEGTGLQPLFDAWRRQRDDAREVLTRELDGQMYRRLVDDFTAFVTEAGADARAYEAREAHLVRDTAPVRIWAAYHGVRAYDSVIRWADIATLHALRIDAKRLRYALEFFRETLGAEAGDLIARTVALQDHLGLLHDADVGAALARQFLAERATELQASERNAIGRYIRFSEGEVRRLSRSVGRPWRGVEGITFRRMLGRALAGL
jgi:triphosphatase